MRPGCCCARLSGGRRAKEVGRLNRYGDRGRDGRRPAAEQRANRRVVVALVEVSLAATEHLVGHEVLDAPAVTRNWVDVCEVTEAKSRWVGWQQPMQDRGG